MKQFNKFIITLLSILVLSIGYLKAETLADIEKELNNLRESISNLDTSTVKEAITIDKSLQEVTKTVDFVSEKIKEGDIDAAVAAINFADKVIADIASTTIPKEFETEVIKKGEEYTPEKLKEVTDVTSKLSGNKDKKTQKIAEDMMIAQNSGLDTFAIAENLNEFGINTINAKDIVEAITKAQQANSLTALRRATNLASEINDQERFASILGKDPEEVDIYLRQAEVIRSGDPKDFRAIEIEKYGRAMGLSKERINKGVQAVYTGDWETEKQVSKEIYQAAKNNPNYSVNIEITDAVMNDLMKEDIAKENVVYGVMNSKVFGAPDLKPYIEDGVVITDVEGWLNAQKSNAKKVSDFADEVGDYMANSGAFSDQTIRMVKHTINYNGSSGRSSKTIASMVMRELQDDNYKAAYNAVDRNFNFFEKRGTESLAKEAARIEAQLSNNYYSFDAALGAKEITKLNASEKEKLIKVYNGALDYYAKKNANLAVKDIETSTILATEAAAEVVEAEVEMEEYNRVLQEKITIKEKAEKKYKEVLELQKKGEATLQESIAAQQKSGKAFADLINTESQAGKIKRKLDAAKALAATTKNKLNMSTTNAAQAGVSVELIEDVAISTSEKTFETIIKKEAQKASIEAEKSAKVAELAAAEAATEIDSINPISEEELLKSALKATESITKEMDEDAAKAKAEAKQTAMLAARAKFRADSAKNHVNFMQMSLDSANQSLKYAADQAARATDKDLKTAWEEQGKRVLAHAKDTQSKLDAAKVAQTAAVKAADTAASEAAAAATNQAVTAAASTAAKTAATAAAETAAKQAASTATKQATEAKKAAAATAAKAATDAKTAAEESAKQAAADAKTAAADAAKAAATAAAKAAADAKAAAEAAAKQAAADAKAAAEAAAKQAAAEAAKQAEKAAEEARLNSMSSADIYKEAMKIANEVGKAHREAGFQNTKKVQELNKKYNETLKAWEKKYKEEQSK